MRSNATGILKEVTLTTAAATYSANDQVGTAIEIPEAVISNGAFALLESLALVDKAAQNTETDLFFFDEQPTLTSSDQDAFALSDAEMSDKCIGAVTIAAADYDAAAASSIASLNNIGLMLRAAPKKGGNKSVWVVAVTRGTPTYASTTDLILKLGLVQF